MQSRREYEIRVCRAIDFINANLAQSPSVEEIAAAAMFSPFHFQRLFRAIVGESVAQFTRRIRLDTAARKLASGVTIEITDLAFELGFSSSQNFAKAFRKQFGQSPTQFMEDRRPGGLLSDEQYRLSSNSLNFRLSHSDGVQVPDVHVQEMDEQKVAYIRHFGSYNDKGVQSAFDELETFAAVRGYDLNATFIGIPWDDSEITPDDKCRFDAGIVVEQNVHLPQTINRQALPSGKYAVFRTEITGHDFDLPWTTLMRDWLPGSGCQPGDGPRFERYFSDGSLDPQGRWDLQVNLPIRPL
ncbi:MAG: AraC family transcriptional regulator [Planctomycetota bacterium]